MKKSFLILFIIAGCGEIASTIISANVVHVACKPFIIISLIGYYVTSVNKSGRSKSLLGALVFCLVGDVLLMLINNHEIFFKLGLASFLIAHIFYILTYRQHKNDEAENTLQGIQKIRFAFPIILCGTGLIVVLYPMLGDLKIPVMLYSLVLVLMVLNALFRYGCTNYTSFWMVFTGAILFMISDSILAMNKFVIEINNSNLWIMITYCAAQYLIVQGLINHPPQASAK